MFKTDNFQVAIDGPVGAGKSTVARLVALRSGFVYIDTGAMYRAVGLYARRLGVALDNFNDPGGIGIELEPAPDGQLVFLNGENITDLIRTPQASKDASAVAVHARVRSLVTRLAKEHAANHSVVMDGRDIGTVVLPNARLKIYLDAAPEIRARRRFQELFDKGQNPDFETVKADVLRRDFNDSNREADPLRPAADAVHVDVGGISADQVTDLIVALINERRA